MVVRAGKAVGALLVLVALIVVPPWLLVRYIGNPWPQEGVAVAAPMTDAAIIGLLACVVWLLWMQLMLCLAAELVAAVTRDRIRPRVPLAGAMQHQLARRLVTAFVVAAAPASTITTGPAIAAPAPAPVLAGASVGAVSTVDAGPPDSASQNSAARARQEPVGRYDTLWTIAERVLGSGDRWEEIAEFNEGKRMRDGRTFHAADPIQPGWRLLVPASDTTAGDGGSDETTDTARDDTDQVSDERVRQVQVDDGDSLWEIAQEQLDDPAQWPSIYQASRDLTQPHGQRLTDPDHIEAGWTLNIPTTDKPQAHTPDTGGPGRPDKHNPGRDDTDHDDTDHDHPGQNGAGQNGAGQEDASGDGGRRGPHSGPEDQADAPGTEGQDRTESPAASDVEATDEAEEDQWWGAPWVLPGLTTAGAMLAGSMLLRLRRSRRAQARHRRPGFMMTPPPPESVPAERTLIASEQSAVTVLTLDRMLRDLAAAQAKAGQPMPALAAAVLTGDRITVHLTEPADLPAPWTGTPDRLHWHHTVRDGQSDHDRLDGEAFDVENPFPLLVTIGDDENGTWLLNLEEYGSVTVTGDPERGRDFARHIAGQVAVNPWSTSVDVDCIGVAADAAKLSDRVVYRPTDLPAADEAPDVEGIDTETGWLTGDVAVHDAADIDHEAGQESGPVEARVDESGLEQAAASACTTVARATRHDTDVPTARARTTGGDAWPARLVIAEACDRPLPDWSQLADLVKDHPRRTGTAILLAGPDPVSGDRGAELRINADGQLTIDHNGITVAAVGLTADELRGCALLWTHTHTTANITIPDTGDNATGSAAFATQVGALRAEHTRPRHTADTGTQPSDTDTPQSTDSEGAQGTATQGVTLKGSTDSLLPEPDSAYLASSAVLGEDLEALAPRVSGGLRARVEDADPSLDQDLADWLDSSSSRPRLTLLGPVAARTRGKALASRKPYFTELFAFIALHPKGVTVDQISDAFGIKPSKARDYVSVLRGWLGTNPDTRHEYLPYADQAASDGGVARYQIEAPLVDLDLFRRLRTRGEARGSDGIEDLTRALDLVGGRPFDHLRPGGYNWLAEGERHDQYATVAIADVCFLVNTHHLEQGNLTAARTVCETALIVAPDEDATRLCHVRILDAEGDRRAATTLLSDQVCNRTDDHQAPDEPPARTRQVIRDHPEWGHKRTG